MKRAETVAVLTAAQCRAGRALLDWSQDELATKAGISRQPLAHFEGDKSSPYASTLDALRSALERGGVEFVPEGAYSGTGGAGVRLRGKRRG